MGVVVLRETELSIEAMTGLVADAGREGDRSLTRLLEAYTRGAYRGRGELILAAWERSVIIGLIAVERAGDDGRVSALFVAPADRRRGVARELVRRAAESAARTFTALVVDAPPSASAFVAAVGFLPEGGRRYRRALPRSR